MRDMKRKPKPGDKFFPTFEDDYTKGAKLLTILEVDNQELNDGGFWVLAVDENPDSELGEIFGGERVWYDCYWSKKLKLWVYALGNGT